MAVVIADTDMREADPSCHDVHKRGGGGAGAWGCGCNRQCGHKGTQPSSIQWGVLPIVGTVPALAKGTASFESASGAERTIATRPETLEPRIYDEAGCNGTARDPNRQQMRASLVASNGTARAGTWLRCRYERASMKSRHRHKGAQMRARRTLGKREDGRMHEVLLPEGECMVETLPHKGSHKPEALP